MPELPEVEIVKRGLGKCLTGKTIKAVDVRYKKSFDVDPKLIRDVVIGSKIKTVERKQKIIIFNLSSGWAILIHLKMTGQLLFLNDKCDFVGGHPQKAYDAPVPHKHTHIIVKLNKGTLYFNDVRKFGWWRLRAQDKIDAETPTVAEEIKKLKIGPDPLSREFKFENFYAATKGRKLTIKQYIMDQSVAAGVGNIYADEALFKARINPRLKVNRVSKFRFKKLFEAIKVVLRQGIKYGGTSVNSYRNVEGSTGQMQNHLYVYGKEGENCRICGTIVKRVVLGSRSAHFCPKCQK